MNDFLIMEASKRDSWKKGGEKFNKSNVSKVHHIRGCYYEKG
jgi:hypothetical protein